MLAHAVHDVGHYAVGLRGLDHQDNYIHSGKLRRCRGGVETGEDALLALAAESKAVGRYLVHVRLVLVDKVHVRSAAVQVRRKHTPGRAGAYHCDFHWTLLLICLIYSSPPV